MQVRTKCVALLIFRFPILYFSLSLTKVLLLFSLNFLSVFYFFEKALLVLNALAL